MKKKILSPWPDQQRSRYCQSFELVYKKKQQSGVIELLCQGISSSLPPHSLHVATNNQDCRKNSCRRPGRIVSAGDATATQIGTTKLTPRNFGRCQGCIVNFQVGERSRSDRSYSQSVTRVSARSTVRRGTPAHRLFSG